jgi:hypothetical protein
VARQTRPPPSSGLPGRLPGLGHARTIELHGDPRRGAAEAAPTAPHATAPTTRDTSGPARFWDLRRVRVALGLTLASSLAVHAVFTPWRLLPDRSGIELKDPEGELTIPVDLLGEDQPPPAPAPPEPSPPAATADPNGASAAKPDASAPKPKDAGPPDAQADAEPLATDAGASRADAGTPIGDAGEGDGASPEGGLVATADAGGPAGASGPRDPGSMIGMAGLITAGQVNVTLLVNVAVIRTNPVGARMGPLLGGIPQWSSFLKGTQSTFDPIRDTDWILIYGPSLIHTDRDAFIIRYSTSDGVVENAADLVSKMYDKGGPVSSGVPGVKAWLFHADNAERVALRAQPHVLVIVPPDKKTDFAKVMSKAPISPKVRAGEAMRLTVKEPWRQISIPGLRFEKSLKEIRLWVVPRASDDGADVFAEGDCTDEAAAADSADALTELIKRQNTMLVRAATRGLLNNARVVPEGTHVKLHLSVSHEQLEALLQGVAAFMGVQVPPAAGGPH